MVSNKIHEINDPRYYLLLGALKEGKSGLDIKDIMGCSKSQVSKLRKKWGLDVKSLRADPTILNSPPMETLETLETHTETSTTDTNGDNENVSIDYTDSLIPEDLMVDILKVKQVMEMFGDKARLTEVQNFLDKMGALKPTREEAIKTSLRRESIESLTSFILPQDWEVEAALPPNIPSETLDKIIGELDI